MSRRGRDTGTLAERLTRVSRRKHGAVCAPEYPVPPKMKPSEDHVQRSEDTYTTHELEPLPPPLDGWLRTILLALGTVFVLIGLIGLALPVVPQAIPLALGAAMLSLASERLHHGILGLLSRWPAAARVLVSFRTRMHRRLHHLNRRRPGGG